jgi:hypothetical protein
MKRWLCVAVLPALVATGCESMSNTDKGVLGGGAIGAGTGALIGSATHHAGPGALIGGAVGALSGGLIGNSIDNSEKKAQAAAVAAANAQPPLGLTDVVRLAQDHVSDSVIISQIRSTNSIYHLSPADIEWLKSNGVSDAVVIEMQATANRYPRRVYTSAPVYGPPPVVIVEQPPPPPIGVGVGFRIH